jgi:hypothetical protein
MKRAAILTIVAMSLAFSEIPAKAQSPRQQLVGAWTFVSSSTTKLADGSPVWGSNPKGLLIFAESSI